MNVFHKDTETRILTWSSIVLAMNISGSFSYTVTGRGTVGDQSPQRNHRTYSEKLRYSNLVFLWGVFTSLLKIACSLHLVRNTLPQIMKPDIASMTIAYCSCAWIMVGAIIPTILLARSRQFASILEQRMSSSSSLGREDKQKDVQVPTGWKRFKGISNWIKEISCVWFIVFCYWYSFCVAEMNTVSEIIILGIFFPIYITGIYANLEVTKSFFNLLSTQLVRSAKFSLHTLIQETHRTDELVGPNVNMIKMSLHRMKPQVRSVSTVYIKFCRYTI